jgi:hypothetical protein
VITVSSSVPVEIDYFDHEALDRASLAMEFVCENLCEHEGIQRNPQWKALAHKACDVLNELYQEIGRTHA